MGDSYSAAISKNAPREGADLLRARALNGKHTNERLAEWLKDYSQLQRRHASELEHFLAKHIVDDQDLGTLAEPWQKVSGLVAEQCRLAQDVAKRVQVEAERPIREQAFWSRAERALTELSSGASSPELIIDQIQRLDEQRLDNIKNSLARFSTVEVDRAQSQISVAERAVQAWLVYEPQDDISSYVAQVVSGVAPSASSGTDGRGASHGAAGGVQRPAASSRQSSQTSQSTVRRRASMLLNVGRKDEGHSSSGHSGSKSPGSNLRSKVGSIFGRKKKNQHASSPALSGSSADANSRSAVTRPPDFGPRQHSQLSLQSNASSPTSSLRHSRLREGQDDLYSPSSPSPRRSNLPPASGQLHGVAQPNLAAQPSGAQANLNGSSSIIAPLTPTKAQPGSRKNSVTRSSPARSPSPLHEQSNVAKPGFGAQQPQQQFREASPQQYAKDQVHSPVDLQDGTHAPAPPPARSVHRQGSLNRTPSAASARVQRSGSLQRNGSQSQREQPQDSREARDSRVGSQVFSSLPLAQQDSGRNSTFLKQGFQPNFEGSDRLGPLPPIPATPATVPGSPEQFWTPAARFPTQFTSFEHANTSIASLTSARAPALPPLPAVEGLVAAAVEHIVAEYEGEVLVRGSIQGEAIAQVNGGGIPGQESMVLGILLADPNSKLTPSPLLRQTSSLSFDLPVSTYSAPQELVKYTAESAVGRVPLKLTPVWRFDSSTVRLVLSFQLSDLYVGGDEVEVNDLVIAVSIRGEARAHSAQSKPVATFSREKQRVTWRFNQPQILRRGQAATRLLCQFVTDGAASQPGTIELKARLPSITNSVLQLRTLSPQGEWVPVPSAIASEVQSKFEDVTAPPPVSTSAAPGTNTDPLQNPPLSSHTNPLPVSNHSQS